MQSQIKSLPLAVAIGVGLSSMVEAASPRAKVASSISKTPTPVSRPTNSLNEMASRGHISTMPTPIQNEMRNGNLVAAIPQKVDTRFILKSRPIDNSRYRPIPKQAIQPAKNQGLSQSERMAVNQQKGQAFEDSVRRNLKLGKKPTRPTGGTIPDAKSQGHFIEMKNVNRLSNSRQLTRQRAASSKKHIVITAPRTKVSKPLQKRSEILYYIP